MVYDPDCGEESAAKSSIILNRDELTELLAKAMAYRGVGDPNALDIHGNPRWKWYQQDAEQFVTTYFSATFRQLSQVEVKRG